VVIEDPKTGETREVPELLAGWVYEWGGKDDPDKVYATFRPVKVGRLAREALWPKAKQFLLMDATPVSVEQLLEDDLGLEPGEYAVVQMESTFPPERRPVIVDSRADMKWSKEHGGIHPSELAKMRDAIDEIIEDNPGVRILVHTVSYALGKYLYEHSGSDRVMTYWSSNERDQALSAFLAKEDSVLLAPSFERGIDLPEEDCRVIIVAKCPFPFLGDARVKKRLYGDRAKGQRWYDIETIRSLVQMTGRGMRHKGDFCKSVLLDSQIRRVYLKQQKYFPQWWRDAVILGQYDPKSQERLEKVMAIEEEINGRRRDRALAGGRGGGGKDDSLPDPF
jgi:Rad3-related DNA helicase